MLPSVCRLYRKERLLAACYRNAGLTKSPTSARSAQVRLSHDVMLSRLRALEPSCSRTLMLSGSPAVMPSCYRATKLSYRKESGNALLFFLWLLVSSSLTPSPALSSSQAKEYAPSVTRFPFLLVQVSKIVFPSRRGAHFWK